MTNEVIQNILTRRSVRAFQERPVEREKIDAILQCAVQDVYKRQPISSRAAAGFRSSTSTARRP